jgi:hypothetical protein
MHGESETQACPSEIRALIRLMRFMGTAVPANLLLPVFYVAIVLVEMKHPHHKKHEQQTHQTNPHYPRRVPQDQNGMGQQIQQGHPQHHARHKAEDHHRSPMSQIDQRRQCPTENREEGDQTTIN